MKPYHPHDIFFKGIMQLHDIVMDLIRGIFPATLQVLVKRGVLTPYKADFLPTELREVFADVTYQLRIPGGLTIDIVLLFEHKSYLPRVGVGATDKAMLLQLLQYIVGVWDLDYKQKSGYQLLLPIIFYQGRKPWPYGDLRQEMFGSLPQGLDAELAAAWQDLQRFQPAFDYILINVQEYDEARVQATFTDGMLNASLTAMRDYALGEPVMDIKRYFSNLEGVPTGDLSADFMKSLANYILALNKRKQRKKLMKTMRAVAEKIHPSDEPGFVSALDEINEIIARGEAAETEIAKAKAEAEKAKADAEKAYQDKLAIAKNLKERNMSVEDVALLCNLPIEIIKGL